MSAVENFVGMVIIAAIVMIGWLLIQTTNINQAVNLTETNELFFQQEKLNNDISIILETTEPLTKLSMKKIIGDLIYSRQTTIQYAGQEVNLKEYVEEYFDAIYGKENYYLSIQPPLKKIRLYFVIDGSGTMKDDLKFVTDVLPKLTQSVKEIYSKKQDRNLFVETKVYVLKGPSNDDLSCSNITSSIANCEDIPLEFTSDANGISPKDVNGLYNKFFTNTLKNSLSEYFLGESKTLGILKGFSYEDWATGVAYVAKSIEETKIDDSNNPTMTFIFPFSDELSSGSEADYCFDFFSSENILYRKNEDYYTHKFISCSICGKDQDRFSRADKTISHAISVLKDYDYKVFPIAKKPNRILNDIIQTIENKFKTEFYNRSCDGYRDSNSVHGSSQVINGMLEDMNNLASGANGKVLDFTKSTDFNQDVLFSAFNEVIEETTNLEMGTKKENEERFAIKRVFPLGNNNLADLTLWVYKNKKFHDVEDFQAINLAPHAIIYTDKTWGKTPLEVIIDGRASYDPNGDYPLTMDWNIIDLNTNTKIHPDSGALIDTNFVYEFTAPEEQIKEYQINLVVKDSTGKIGYSSKKITVSNIEPKMTLYFVSLNDSKKFGNYNDLINAANTQAEDFLKNIGCRDQIEVVIIDPNVLTCPEDFSQIKSCIGRAYSEFKANHDRIIGLSKTSLSFAGAAGYTMMGSDVVFSVAKIERPEVTAHELGHTYNACEEYNTSWWLQQNNNQLSAVGGCINDYPIICGSCEKPTTIKFVNGFCVGTTLGFNDIRLQHAYNCNKIASETNVTIPNTCGNGSCDSGENQINCFCDCREQMVYDCPGSPVYRGTSIIGVSTMGGPGTENMEKFYPEKMKSIINTKICEVK